MQQPAQRFLTGACLAGITMTGCASNAVAPPAGIGFSTPQYLATRSEARLATTSEGVPYQGGLVLVQPKLYLVFWGYKKYGDPDKVAALLTAYLKAMGGSGHNNIYTQYYDTLSSKKAYIQNPRMQLGGVWDDETDKVPKSPTDEQVAQEALAAHNHFGATAENAFVIATPHGRNTSGFGTKWCAYHNGYNFSGYIYYINLPYIPDAGANCGANFIQAPKDESGADEGVTIVAGVEEGDLITDPVPGTGWVDSGGGEISSRCAWTDVENDPFGKRSYTMGSMFSDASLSCVQTYKKLR